MFLYRSRAEVVAAEDLMMEPQQPAKLAVPALAQQAAEVPAVPVAAVAPAVAPVPVAPAAPIIGEVLVPVAAPVAQVAPVVKQRMKLNFDTTRNAITLWPDDPECSQYQTRQAEQRAGVWGCLGDPVLNDLNNDNS